MESKIYYGEYSLEHWKNLILKKNIILPEYQRYFVWDKERAAKLIESLKNDEFVPPVTIGLYEKEGEKVNFIIDGQQRLTSILLSYLGKFPNRSFKASEQLGYASEKDEGDDPDDEPSSDDVKEWNLSKLTEKGTDISSILEKIEELETGNYDNIDEKDKIDEKFLQEKYLGFSYIVPRRSDDDDEKFYSEQKKFYSSIFRKINVQGMRLKDIESRKSLYFLDDKMKNFFDPDFQNLMLSSNGIMDFTRYVALLSNYYHLDKKRVAYRYSKRMEELYANFIYFIVNSEQEDLFNPLPNNIMEGNYEPILRKIKKAIDKLFLNGEEGKAENSEPVKYSSIIDLDVRLFGLIDVYIFQGKEINFENIEIIRKEIDDVLKEFKDTPLHEKNPNALKYLKERIEKSIVIYGKYVK